MRALLLLISVAVASGMGVAVPQYDRPECEPYLICNCKNNTPVAEIFGPQFGVLDGKLNPAYDVQWAGCSGPECDIPLICLDYVRTSAMAEDAPAIPDCRRHSEFCISFLNQDRLRFKLNQMGVDSFCGDGRTCTFEKHGGKIIMKPLNASENFPDLTVNTFQPGYQLGPYRNFSEDGELARQVVWDVSGINKEKKELFEKQAEAQDDSCLFSKDCKNDKKKADAAAANPTSLIAKSENLTAAPEPTPQNSLDNVKAWQEKAAAKMEELKATQEALKAKQAANAAQRAALHLS